jgi:hypothetical protein
MLNSQQMIEMARARLSELEAEREVLLGLIRFYEGVRPDATPTVRSQLPSTVRRVEPFGNPFTAVPGGPTESVLQVVADHPGLPASKLIDAVVEKANTNAKNPRRTIASTTAFLVKQGRLKKVNGRFFLPNGNGTEQSYIFDGR